MRRHVGLAITVTLTNDQCCNKTCDTSIDVNNRTASEVKNAVRAEEAAAPYPMCNRHIDDEEPQNHEDQHGGELHALCKRTCNQRRRDNRKGHLEHDEEVFRDGAGERIHRYASKECLIETTDKGVH